MKIRNLSVVAALVIAAISLSSCEKMKINQFKGNYSFKTSGFVTMEKTALTEGAQADKAKYAITAESGQMNIVTGVDNSLIITMNIIGGDVVVTDASYIDGELMLEPFTRMLTIADGSRNVSMEVTVTGSAAMHDDLIIFDLTYRGSGSTTLNNYAIVSSEIKCVAKTNE